MAKVYLKAHDPQFCERTWSLLSDAVQHTYEGPTKARWEKFIRSEPMQGILEKQLIQTTSCHFLAVLNHPGAGVSTNVFLRILHKPCFGPGDGSFSPSLRKRAGPKIRYGHRLGITREEHERILVVTKRQDYRDFFELLWKPVVLRRILRVSRLTILIGQIDGCITNGRSWNHVVRVGLVWRSVAVSKAF
jgi:hypothetical protein